MHATSRAAAPRALKRSGAATERALTSGLLAPRRGRPAAYRVDLPWEDFAQAWSQAEDRLGRLEQQLSSSDLRHFWICRADFEEAAALAALQGDTVAMEDLVMVDAGGLPRGPSAAWQKARALLSLRRHISRAGPARVLTCDGILTLAARMAEALESVEDPAPEAGASAAGASEAGASEASAEQPRRQRVQRWLDAVDELQSTPPLPAAAIALRVWRRIAPLDTHNEEIGLLLAATLLWHWGKTKGLTAGLARGLQAAGHRPDDRAPLGTWIRRFCEAVELAAADGQERHRRMAQGRARVAALLTRHRANSRLARLAGLFLAYPAIPARFINRRLEMTAQGSDWLLQELIRENVVTEVTGRSRNRSYGL